MKTKILWGLDPGTPGVLNSLRAYQVSYWGMTKAGQPIPDYLCVRLMTSSVSYSKHIVCDRPGDLWWCLPGLGLINEHGCLVAFGTLGCLRENRPTNPNPAKPLPSGLGLKCYVMDIMFLENAVGLQSYIQLFVDLVSFFYPFHEVVKF